jgi:hypothetical protein
MKTQKTAAEMNTDRLGRQLSAQLSLATPSLPHDISERLRVARHLALSQRTPVVQMRFAKDTQIQSNGTLTASGDEGLNLWSILGSALPVLALVIGLGAIQWIQQDNRTNELAAIDAALLTDELPPDAYADAGFVQFLKQGLSDSVKND